MVISPFIVYQGATALDVRKSTMWVPQGPDVLVYSRGSPGVPTPTPAAGFEVAKQADVDAAPFVP